MSTLYDRQVEWRKAVEMKAEEDKRKHDQTGEKEYTFSPSLVRRDTTHNGR